MLAHTLDRPLPAAVLAAALVLVLCLGGCGQDATGPTDGFGSEPAELGVVLNSVDRSLTIFSVEAPDDAATVGLGADGTPVGFSLRGNVAVVPMGTVPSAAVVDVRARRLVRSVGLPELSGATGSAFANDSVAIVANSNLDTVTPVNVLRGTSGPQIEVGRFPQAAAAVGGRIFVANARLENFAPLGPGTLTVLDASTLEVDGEISLSGLNPSALAAGPGGLLWVLNSGEFGGGNGSVSAVDPEGLTEVAHHSGFGEFPGSLTFGPGGRLHVSSLSYGLAIWDPAAADFVRAPAEAVAPNGIASVADAAFDFGGRLYTLATVLPDQDQACFQPGAVYRLDADRRVVEEITVGTCPFQVAFFRSPA